MSPGCALTGLLSGGPRVPSPAELSSTEHFIAAADAHRPVTSLLQGTSATTTSHSGTWWTAEQLARAQKVHTQSDLG